MPPTRARLIFKPLHETYVVPWETLKQILDEVEQEIKKESEAKAAETVGSSSGKFSLFEMD